MIFNFNFTKHYFHNIFAVAYKLALGLGLTLNMSHAMEDDNMSTDRSSPSSRTNSDESSSSSIDDIFEFQWEEEAQNLDLKRKVTDHDYIEPSKKIKIDYENEFYKFFQALCDMNEQIGIEYQVDSSEMYYSFERDKIIDLTSFGITKLPPEIGDLTNLKSLCLTNNNLSILPDEICNLFQLTDLDVGENILESLPEFFGNLKSLKNLLLCSNKIKNLPESFGDLSRLESANFEYNEITNLCESFGKLVNLKELFLHENPTSMILPESISDLPALDSLCLWSYKFIGTLMANDILGKINLEIQDLELNDIECPHLVGIQIIQFLKKHKELCVMNKIFPKIILFKEILNNNFDYLTMDVINSISILSYYAHMQPLFAQSK